MDDWDSLGEGFDIETYLVNEEKREKIQQLARLASDCYDELQYAKAGKFSQRAVDLSEQIDDLSLTIKNRFWLAAAQRMQGENQAALSTFTWLIEVAYDPDLSRELCENDMYFIEGGFRGFVEVGLYLPDMSLTDLEKALERGMDWLSTIGKNNWSAGMRLQRGCLWQQQGYLEKALPEMETALALKRRNTSAPGFAICAHILHVASLLQEMEELTEAEEYYQQVADSYEFDDYGKQWAWGGLAQVSIKRSDWQAAEQRSLKALELARGMESPSSMLFAYNILASIYTKQNLIEPAITAKIQALHYSRQLKEEVNLCNDYLDFAEIRLYQARQSNPTRHIPKAQQWLRRALPLAIRLDNQVNSNDRQTKIRDLQNQCAEIRADS
jgi:tetratricopeptide (TPR) repeat protein